MLHIDHDKLPNISLAKYPEAYLNAKVALQKCHSVDECQDWADKMAALASYAKMSEDTTLEKLCRKIRCRAIDRCGDLLKELDARGGDRSKKVGDPLFAPISPSREKAATDAGMSDEQRKTAIRVSNVPEEVFEAMVESDNPPTITELAEIGKKARPKPKFDLEGRTPLEFQTATTGRCAVDGPYKAAIDKVDVAIVVRGSFDSERQKFLERAEIALEWLTKLVIELRKAVEK